MIKRPSNDWIAGDLLKVTRDHFFSKGDPKGVWPEVFLKEGPICDTPFEIPIGTVIMALDDKPPAGQKAYIRVLHDDGVWVANSNNVTRESCTIAKQEKFLL